MSDKFPPLALPDTGLRLRPAAVGGGAADVFDAQRRRWVRLTPEEWVRQHFVAYLLSHLGYPRGLVSNEVCIRVGQTEKRCDTVVYAIGAAAQEATAPPAARPAWPATADQTLAPQPASRAQEAPTRPAQAEGALRPLMIVEYKAPQVQLTEAVFRQVLRYDTALQVPLLAVSNGLRHYCCRLVREEHRFAFLQEFPRYEEALRLR